MPGGRAISDTCNGEEKKCEARVGVGGSSCASNSVIE